MSRQLHTLFVMNNALLNLDWAQQLIDWAREANPTNQELQLQLDRRQSELDERRQVLLSTYYEIASSN